MEHILLHGLEFIRLIQTFTNPAVIIIMRLILGFGDAFIFLALLPLIYWCINERKAAHIYTAILISLWINIIIKFLLNQPRPFFPDFDPSVGIINVSLGGLPSEHAQTSIVMFFIAAALIKRKWAFISAGIICVLIGFSGVYLGIYFPTDIPGGWILGGIVLCIYFLFNSRIEALLVKSGYRGGMISSAALSLLMILYIPGKEILFPAGTMLGIGTGYFLNRRYIGFTSPYNTASGTQNAALGTVSENTKKYFTLVIRFLLGTTGLVLIYNTVGKIIPQDSINYNLYSFIHYALCGLWVSAAAPWIFVKLSLTETSTPETKTESKE
jgi:membrane-associated phospholipid phosphatase